MASGKKHRSLGLNVTAPVQSTFILIEFILLMFTMVFLLYLIFDTMNEAAYTVTAVESRNLDIVLDQISFLLLVRVSCLFVIVFIVHIIVGLFFLHRLTGPLQRMKTIFDQIAAGKPPKLPVTLRRGDFPTEVSESLTRALRRISEWKEDQ